MQLNLYIPIQRSETHPKVLRELAGVIVEIVFITYFAPILKNNPVSLILDLREIMQLVLLELISEHMKEKMVGNS